MHFGISLLKRCVNYALKTLGFEARRIRNIRDEWSMESALERLSRRELNVRSIIDIGAARGDWTQLARRYFKESNVLMIDPLKENEGNLYAKATMHDNSSYVIAAAGSKTEPVLLNVSSDLDGSGVYGVSGEAEETRTVPQVRLDDIVQEKGLTGPFLIKFDTHGYEVPILEGAEEVLKHTCAIVMECYTFPISPTSRVFWDICALLNRYGFQPIDLAEPMHRPLDGALWQMDLVFLNSKHVIFTNTTFR